MRSGLLVQLITLTSCPHKTELFKKKSSHRLERQPLILFNYLIFAVTLKQAVSPFLHNITKWKRQSLANCTPRPLPRTSNVKCIYLFIFNFSHSIKSPN